MNANEFFRKIIFLKKENINVFWKGKKRKVAVRMHYSQAELYITSKITLQPKFLILSNFSLVLL